MKQVETKEMPEISGGEVDVYGNPVPIAQPIYTLPIEQPIDPMIVPETPLA